MSYGLAFCAKLDLDLTCEQGNCPVFRNAKDAA